MQAQAFTENLDLAQAWARLRQSEARARKAGADLYPQADLSTGYRRNWRESGANTAESNYTTGISVSYEVDLWGKIRAGQILVPCFYVILEDAMDWLFPSRKGMSAENG